MAIIDNQVPAPAAPRAVQRRVVVKTRQGAEGASRHDAAAFARRGQGDWERLSRDFPGVRLEPLFGGLDDDALSGMARRARSTAGRALPATFAAYVAVACPAEVDPERLAGAIRDWPGVETAYVEGGPTPPPVSDGDDPRSGNQGYLDAAPAGIDARWTWTSTGADGTGAGIVDLEQGWTLDHEDLAAAGITLISGTSEMYHGHGTAVLGELRSVDNTLGGIGIAPNAGVRVVSQWRPDGHYNTAEAILSAVDHMSPGQILLLEAQTAHPNAAGYVPVEVDDAVFDAIAHATAEGIVVVEAGANGSVDLDTFTNSSGKRILNRAHADFRDSGAILVGAASAAVPHTRLWFSNFGSRIDCYAWGGGIDTTGDGWTGQSTTAYTTAFGGTSGASPIVTGAAALLQSWRVASGHPAYPPALVRALLADPANNTASATPATDRIGVMPNLRAVITAQTNTFELDFRRWVAVVAILFGVVNDGGGVVWKPGTGPIPIDPWGPMKLQPYQRDVLAGLAATELAKLASDEASRKELTTAALKSISRAVAKGAKT